MTPHSFTGAKRAHQFPGKAFGLSVLGLLATGALAPAAHAVTPVPFTGSYTENFNTLPTVTPPPYTGKGPFDVPTQGGGTLPGWQFAQIAGSGANVLFKAEAGVTASGSAFSYGDDGLPERALGALASGSSTVRVGAIFRNDSQTTYSNFTIDYTGEQWRVGGTSAVNNTFAFNYQVVATQPADISAVTPAGTAFPGLDFNTPIDSGTTSPVDGNSDIYSVPVSGTVTGLSWAPGQFLVIRFDDFNDASNDHGIAIDDLTLTASATAVQTDPTISNGTATPNNVEQGQTTLLTADVLPGANPVSTGLSVVGNLLIIGGSETQQFFDDGTNGDAEGGDGTYSYLATVAADAAVGSPNIAVRVSDDQNRTDTTSIALTVQARTFPSTTLVISEFRAAGPGNGSTSSAADEFVEILNISGAPIDIAGYQLLYAPSSGSPASPFIVTFGPRTVVGPGERFLFAPPGSTAEPSANATYPAGIAPTGGLAIADASGTIFDAVGQSTGTVLKEGTPVSGLTDTTTQSYERREFGTNTTDTQNNASDFGVSTANPQGLPPVGANNPPKLNNETYSAANGTPFSQQLMATDADGDTLTYALANGTTLPTGLTLDENTGIISGTPTVDGRTDFSVTVSDGRGGTKTSKFIIIVSSAPDALAPVTVRSAIAATLTRDELAGTTVTGTITDIAQGAATPSGVRLLFFQLRRVSDGFAYDTPERGFTANTMRGYYAATLSAPTADTAAPRDFSRSLSFIPGSDVVTPGAYQLVIAGQDNTGNWSVEVVPLTIVAPTNTQTPPSAPIFSGRLS